MISLRTFADLCLQRHSLGLYCAVCDRWHEANLVRLVASGYGDRDVVAARFRCRDCGGVAEKQVRPPQPVTAGAIPYISGSGQQL